MIFNLDELLVNVFGDNKCVCDRDVDEACFNEYHIHYDDKKVEEWLTDDGTDYHCLYNFEGKIVGAKVWLSHSKYLYFDFEHDNIFVINLEYNICEMIVCNRLFKAVQYVAESYKDETVI